MESVCFEHLSLEHLLLFLLENRLYKPDIYQMNKSYQSLLGIFC